MEVYSSVYKTVHVVAEIGIYRIGIPSMKSQEHDNVDEQINFPVPSSDLIRYSINAVLSKLDQEINHDLHFPFRDIKEKIETLFPNTTLAAFSNGQKTNLSSLLPRIVDLFDQNNVEMALGCEFEIENYFISCFYSEKFKTSSYSNFLSSESMNVYIKDENISNTILPRSYRLQLYNNWQHSKKKIEPSIRKPNQVYDVSNENTRGFNAFFLRLGRNFTKLSFHLR